MEVIRSENKLIFMVSLFNVLNFSLLFSSLIHYGVGIACHSDQVSSISVNATHDAHKAKSMVYLNSCGDVFGLGQPVNGRAGIHAEAEQEAGSAAAWDQVINGHSSPCEGFHNVPWINTDELRKSTREDSSKGAVEARDGASNLGAG